MVDIRKTGYLEKYFIVTNYEHQLGTDLYDNLNL